MLLSGVIFKQRSHAFIISPNPRIQTSHYGSLRLTLVQALETVPFACSPEIYFSGRSRPKDSAVACCPGEFEAQLPIQTSHSCTPGTKPHPLTSCHPKNKTLATNWSAFERLRVAFHTISVTESATFWQSQIEFVIQAAGYLISTISISLLFLSAEHNWGTIKDKVAAKAVCLDIL